MGYTERNLISGESIVHKTGLHWITLIGPAIVAGMFLIFGILLLIGAFTDTGLIFEGFGATIFALALVLRNCTEMAVTDKRVIVKVGWLRRKTIEIFLSKVESVIVEQGLFGRMLGYGSIVVRGTGGTAEPFKKVRSPLEFRRQVQQCSESPRPE